MNLDNGPNQIEQENSSDIFLKTFSKEIKKYDSLFINSFPQKINAIQLINYDNIMDGKYLEFNLGSPDMISDLSTLTAFLECSIKELKEDGTISNLPPDCFCGTIPGSIVSNCIRNCRIFIFDKQISPEKSNRYSLLSYIFNFFDKSKKNSTGINLENGSYLDQDEKNFITTSEAKQVSETALDKKLISSGFYESAKCFKGSQSQSFVDRINSPFLFTDLNLLLPKVRN